MYILRDFVKVLDKKDLTFCLIKNKWFFFPLVVCLSFQTGLV